MFDAVVHIYGNGSLRTEVKRSVAGWFVNLTQQPGSCGQPWFFNKRGFSCVLKAIADDCNILTAFDARCSVALQGIPVSCNSLSGLD